VVFFWTTGTMFVDYRKAYKSVVHIDNVIYII
jgi:hypothetical protein